MSPSIDHPTLYSRPLQLRGRRLEKASLFPFFDRQGETRLLMLTTQDSARIALIEHRPGLFQHRYLRPSRLDADFSNLRDATEEDHARLADLWHFDPWWALGEKRYASHPAVPALKATNIPGHDEDWQGVSFDGTLARVLRVTTSDSGADSAESDQAQTQRYTPALLARAESARTEVSKGCRPAAHSFKPWRLSPFWE